ncbi:MAG: cation:dicarboxylase symporter family transporter [candidate division Zixibacteria bacterium]|nr:cation:dicarboxylase symporter family transporter [candidate division Zixibacteria bacterium]
MQKPQPLGLIQPQNLKRLAHHLQTLIKSRLWLQILFGMALGVAVGLSLGPTGALVGREAAKAIGDWLAIPGKIFLTLIQMIVIPLVFSSVILGLAASENLAQLRRLGLRLAPYFVLTTAVAITIGIGASLVVKPGEYIESGMVAAALETEMPQVDEALTKTPTLRDLPDKIVRVLPQNPLGAILGKEMLQIVLFALIIGLALVTLAPEQSRPLLDLLGSVQEVCMKVVRWAMLLAPLAVFGLLAQITARVGPDVLIGTGVYVATVLLGLLAMLCLYLVIVYTISGRAPWNFLGKVRDVQLLAFSTSSSAAVMPLTIKTAEEKLAVKTSIAQFLVPLGTTVNMDGTALYQGAATVFLAQAFGVDLSLGALVLVVVTTVGASIGSPATPGVGIVILATVLASVGIPASGIALILGVDRILDMSRTAVNVTGDLTACVVMDRWVGGRADDAVASQVPPQ